LKPDPGINAAPIEAGAIFNRLVMTKVSKLCSSAKPDAQPLIGEVIAWFSLGSDRGLDQDGASAATIPYNALAFQPCAEEVPELQGSATLSTRRWLDTINN
jgi:hypothetical protein